MAQRRGLLDPRAADGAEVTNDVDDLDDVSDHTKEVYARFGLAFYYAQVLEHGIVNALVLLDLVPKRHHVARTVAEWEEMFDTFMSERFERTMGGLLRDLRAVAAVPDDLEALLRDALTRRNRLAHSFFRDHAERFMTESGRNRMIVEVDECRDIFVTADHRLEEIIQPIRLKAGITNEMIGDMLARMKSDAEGADCCLGD